MPTFIMSVPPLMDDFPEIVMCDVCGNAVEMWIAVRIIVDLVHICSDCVGSMVKADHEMKRQWLDWREHSDYASR